MKSTTIQQLAVLIGMATLVSGCASYEPKPLDAAATRQRLDARTPADEEIIRLAARLAAVPELSARETFNAADALTLAEAEVVALVYNPRLRVARLEVGVTRATAETAGLWDDPVTGINLNDVSQKYGAGLSMGAQIALTIPISGRLAAEKERANAALIADLASVQADEWTAR
ncbi:MAG: hypothetical protein EXS17_06515, partial [Phycisphaerales bacterium]|nr:hypothetical protein [Phycisphaerales bacterium]